MTVRVTVAGATGKLGGLVCGLVAAADDLELIGTVVSPAGGHVGQPVCGVPAVGPDRLPELLENTDVYVDLTAPEAAAQALPVAAAAGANIVLGTTAVPAEVLTRMRETVARQHSSALVSANFSIGINVFWKVCEELAKDLPDYDIEIMEMHHNKKEDAPSGTAAEALRRLQLATGIGRVVYGRQGVVGARPREIGVHSVRAGDIVGDHTVLFAQNMEMLELTHRAVSRETFARGCLLAIRWLAPRKDGKVHNMSEGLNLC